jgi:hypothetical protein
MALITIPTSIGGINIPGFGLSGTSGPLASLYTNGGRPFYKYPRDLGSSTKSHAVVFTIKKINETSLDEVKSTVISAVKTGYGAVKDVYDAGLNGIISSGESGIETVSDTVTEAREFLSGGSDAVIERTTDAIFSGINSSGKVVEQISNLVSSRKTEIIASIALYMPETMVFTNSSQYNDSITLASAAGALPIIGPVVSRLTGAVGDGGNDALRLALNKAGYVFNPQKQLLFQGIEFRQFNMSFTFTPYSAKEAQEVKEIIKLFRTWSLPQKSAAGGGMFFNPPALFGVEFLFNSSQNLNIPKLKDCVIESVEVNYAPNGWAAHGDGAPVQTTVTIQLQEIALVDRTDIQNGY